MFGEYEVGDELGDLTIQTLSGKLQQHRAGQPEVRPWAANALHVLLDRDWAGQPEVRPNAYWCHGE